MKNTLKILLVVALMAFLTAPLSASESVTLRSGAVVVGEVELRDGGATIAVLIRFPRESEKLFRQEEIEPASLYWIHERRTDHANPEGRMRLAELAADAGLDGIAIAEYLAAKDLAPGRARMIDQRVRDLRERIAGEILQSARDLLEDGNANSALTYLHTIEELYPRTNAAEEAAQMMDEAHRLAGASADIAVKTIPIEKVSRTLDAIEKNMTKGDAVLRKAGGHIGSTNSASSDRRALDRAIRYYRKGWEGAQSIPVVIGEEQLSYRSEALRKRVKAKLVTAYLDAASIQLQRTSISKAEEYCNAACELDPENKRTHETHRLILEAKAYGY